MALFVIALAVLVLLAACAPPAAPARTATPAATGDSPTASRADLSSALQAVVAGARQEGTLTLVWSANTLGGGDGAQRMVDALNRRYGLELKVLFTPGPSMDDLAVRLAQELAAGRAATSDVYVGREGAIKELLEQQALIPTDWQGLAADVTPDMVAPGDVAVEYMLDMPGVTYNTNLVPPDRVPQTTADLLRPEWDGKIASTPYATMFDLLGSPELWGSERTLAFARELSPHLAGVMRCGETPRIVSGEFLMLAFDCGRFEARRWREQGAPVNQVILKDAAATIAFFMGVPKNAAHPNAATLYVLEALTPEGQQIIWDSERADHPSLPGSRSAQDLRAAEQQGVKFTHVNVQLLQAYPDYPAVRKQVRDVINRAGP